MKGESCYLPPDESMAGETPDVVLLEMKGGGRDLKSAVWLMASDLPLSASRRTRKR
jgi:hypothetical protein